MSLIRYSFEELAACIAVEENTKRKAPPKDAEAAGGRNNYLTSLAGTMRKRGMSFEAIFVALLAENEKFDEPLSEKEVRAIARSVAGYEVPDSPLPLTDAGNAERFAMAKRGEFRYCPERKTWMHWTGAVWESDSGRAVIHHAKHVARMIPAEAKLTKDSKHQGAIVEWAGKTESKNHLEAMVALAAAEPDIHMRVVAFDADPWLLNCENGVLNLKSGELVEHSPEQYCSRLAKVRYVPGAKHPALTKYLNDISEGDREHEEFLARAFGYSLTGDVSAESLFLLMGEAGSGKTTLVEALKALLGDYAMTTDSRSLLVKKNDDGPRNDLAKMFGKRMVGASEVKNGKAFDEGTVKNLTGGDTITARFLYEEEFDFIPTAKIWMACNHAPVVDDGDSGMWRRLVKVPFRSIPKEKQDPTIKETLTRDPAARSALLAWALNGCADWLSRGRGRAGLAVPKKIEQATNDYRQASNPLLDFMDECAASESDAYATQADVRQAYARWARAAGCRPLNSHEFVAKLESLGFSRGQKWVNDRNQKIWSGFRLIGQQSQHETRF